MKRLVLRGVFLTLITLLLGAPSARAQCDSPEDLVELAAARALVETTCVCSPAISHGSYVKCASQVANQEIGAGRLDPFCRKKIVKCAARSNCGKNPLLRPCCKTNRYGKTICKVRLPEQCRSGPGGSHCVSFTKNNCCDACIDSGMCASPSGAFLEAGGER